MIMGFVRKGEKNVRWNVLVLKCVRERVNIPTEQTQFPLESK